MNVRCLIQDIPIQEFFKCLDVISEQRIPMVIQSIDYKWRTKKFHMGKRDVYRHINDKTDILCAIKEHDYAICSMIFPNFKKKGAKMKKSIFSFRMARGIYNDFIFFVTQNRIPVLFWWLDDAYSGSRTELDFVQTNTNSYHLLGRIIIRESDQALLMLSYGAYFS